MSFVEFQDGILMTGSEYLNQNLGGAPGKGMPMRSETFYYSSDPEIKDRERIVNQGRINIDNPESHYWGSYKQGEKPVMDIETNGCEPRITYLIFNVVSDHTYSFDVTLSAETI